MSNEKNMVLVTGATGNVGRQVVSQLEIITRPYGATGKESIR